MEIATFIFFLVIYGILTLANINIGKEIDRKYREITQEGPKIIDACEKITAFKDDFPKFLKDATGPIVDRMIEDKLNERETRKG